MPARLQVAQYYFTPRNIDGTLFIAARSNAPAFSYCSNHSLFLSLSRTELIHRHWYKTARAIIRVRDSLSRALFRIPAIDPRSLRMFQVILHSQTYYYQHFTRIQNTSAPLPLATGQSIFMPTQILALYIPKPIFFHFDFIRIIQFSLIIFCFSFCYSNRCLKYVLTFKASKCFYQFLFIPSRKHFAGL